MSKVCKRCGKPFPLTDQHWHRDSRSADGFKRQCKLCVSAYRAAYFTAHQSVETLRSMAWYARNEAAARQKTADWRAANPTKVRAQRKRRVQLVSNARGSHTHAEFIDLCISYDFRCLACGRRCETGNAAGLRLTEDHVRPLAKGGTNAITNIQPLCQPCNSAKGPKHIDYRPGWLRMGGSHGRRRQAQCRRSANL